MVGVTAGGRETAAAIRREAAASFYLHGYEATSLRQVAAAVGIKVGSLYNHISGKEELLLAIMVDTMDDLQAEMEASLRGRTGAMERLVAFIECHIRFHAQHAQAVFIGNNELRSLSSGSRADITARRRAYRAALEGLILAVGKGGEADLLDAHLHAFTIVAIGTHVSTWYRPDGGYSLAEIISIYTIIALRGLGVPDAERRAEELLTHRQAS